MYSDIEISIIFVKSSTLNQMVFREKIFSNF